MRILSLDRQPFHETSYLRAAPRGGTESVDLPWIRGQVDALPTGVDALVLASDLQGVTAAGDDGAATLLGIALCDVLAQWDDEAKVPPLNRVGVVLAGDLYSAPSADVRGASGDVRAVWLAFAACCRWVAGVSGNHDVFGTSARETERFRASNGVFWLDGAGTEIDGLRVAGVGGIIGDPVKPGRRTADAYGAALHAALATRPELLVLHEGPDAPGTRGDGSVAIRELIDATARAGTLVVCGHSHWRDPLATLPGGAQVLNVDARAVLLTRAG